MVRILITCFSLLLLSGCATYGVIENATIATASTAAKPYSVRAIGGRAGSDEVALALTFSGGGTRAAALAYGVLEELRDTTVMIDGQSRRLLDEVDAISSVSGGSFTAAYYGLYGERTFEDFKNEFLTQDIQHSLYARVFWTMHLFDTKGRTELAVDLYKKQLFHGATFADMQRAGGPLIIINASDLGNGVRFSFVQEYFDLLCSDLSSFPVERAVAASSAVPVLFNPIVVKNYGDCEQTNQYIGRELNAELLASNPMLAQVIRRLETYSLASGRDYIHLVDGGITDNLGLRAIYEMIEVTGGAKKFFVKTGRKPARNIALISVNASTEPAEVMSKSNKHPSMAETVSSMSGIQIHLYNDATIQLMQDSMEEWAQALSTPARSATPYFVKVGFSELATPEKKKFYDALPTSFSLTDEQVDELIKAGHELLRSDPTYQRFLTDLGGAQVSGR